MIPSIIVWVASYYYTNNHHVRGRQEKPSFWLQRGRFLHEQPVRSVAFAGVIEGMSAVLLVLLSSLGGDFVRTVFYSTAGSQIWYAATQYLTGRDGVAIMKIVLLARC
jgi:hypothetical protein